RVRNVTGVQTCALPILGPRFQYFIFYSDLLHDSTFLYCSFRWIAAAGSVGTFIIEPPGEVPVEGFAPGDPAQDGCGFLPAFQREIGRESCRDRELADGL